jgi:predicted small lipoprotein YifL
MKNKIRLLLLIFLIISIGGCTPKGCSFLPKASLTILQYHLEKSVDEEGGVLTAQIEGVARNDGSAKLEYAEVIGKFYNQDGTLLATGVAKTTSEEPEDEEEKYFSLDPGQIWEFTISYSSAARDAHASLAILSYHLEKNSSGAKIVGQAQNDGDVMLSFAQITGNFYQGEAHPSLKILSCHLEVDSSSTKAVGEVQNDGDVTLSYAQIEVTFSDVAGTTLATGTTSLLDIEVGEIREYTVFYPGSYDEEEVEYVMAKVTDTEYDEEETELASSTASTTDLEVGEIWDFSILYPKEDYEKVEYVTAEVDDESLGYAETYYESAEQVDHVTVKVGTLKGSTVMP